MGSGEKSFRHQQTRAVLDFERELLGSPEAKHGDEAMRRAMFVALLNVRGGRLFNKKQAQKAVSTIFGKPEKEATGE